MSKIIEFKEFSFEIGDKTIKAENFSLCGGDVALLVGKNGAGKSTLFRIFNREGLGYVETHGELLCAFKSNNQQEQFENILSSDDKNVRAIRKSITYLNQVDEALRNFSILDKLVFDVPSDVSNKNDIQNYAEEMYERYLKSSIEKNKGQQKSEGLINKLFNRTGIKTKFASLSGGQKKLVSIMASLIEAHFCESRLILLDEPLNNLDSDNKKIVSDLINNIEEKQDIAIIIITHCQIFPFVNKKIEIADGVIKSSSIAEEEYHKCLGDVDENNNYMFKKC